MIYKVLITVYAFIGMTSSIAYFYQQRKVRLPYAKKLMMGVFFTVHFLLVIIGITLFINVIPSIVIILGITLAWLSRIGNGAIVFGNVKGTHHVATGCFFIVMLLGYYFHL